MALLDGYGPRATNSGLPHYRGALHGHKVWYVVPSYKQIRDVWATILEWTKPRVNKTERTMSFPGGGEICFRVSSQCERLRGVGLDGLIIDEVADISPDTYFASLRPALVDRKGWCWVMGTPQGQGDNLMWVLEEKAKTLPSWTIHHYPTAANPLIDAAEIAEARVLQGEVLYRQEFLAEYVSPRDALFNPDWLTDERMLVPEIPMQWNSVCLSIDPAYTASEKSDWSVICLCGYSQGTVYVDCNAAKRDPATLFQDTIPMWKQYGCPGIVFDSRVFQHFLADAFLSQSQIPEDMLHRVDDKVPKRSRIMRLAKWLSLNKIKILNNEGGRILLNELRAFPSKQSHDDCADALEQGIAALTGEFRDV